MNHHHIWRLRNQHRELEDMIRAERKKPQPDEYVIQQLKRRKLELAECGLVPVTARTHRA